MNKTIIYILCLGAIVACDFFEKDQVIKESKLIAKVYDYKLYVEDLQRVFPPNIQPEDSIEVAKNLINTWAKQKLLLRKSEVNMPLENKELEILVQKYREDLFINSFKKALVSKELDTIISTDEMSIYYEENKHSFRINEELIQFKYIEVDAKAKGIRVYRNLLRSKAKNDLYLLDEHQDEFKSSFLSDSVWVKYKDVERKLPMLKQLKKKIFLKDSYFIAKSYEGSIYYVYIKKVLHRNEIAPLRYLHGIIGEMVVQKRKLQLVHKVEEVLIDDAIKNKQFEIY